VDDLVPGGFRDGRDLLFGGVNLTEALNVHPQFLPATPGAISAGCCLGDTPIASQSSVGRIGR